MSEAIKAISPEAIAISIRPLTFSAINHHTFPISPDESAQLNRNLRGQFRSWLSPDWRAVCDRQPAENRTEEEKDGLSGQFDRFLVSYAAPRIGLAVLECEDVRLQLHRWNNYKREKFFAALLRSMETRKGDARAIIDQQTANEKALLIPEVKRLRELLGSQRLVKRRAISIDDALGVIQENLRVLSILNIPDTLISFERFCRDNDVVADTFLNRRRGLGDAEFVDEWLAWSMGQSAGNLRRQLIRFKAS